MFQYSLAILEKEVRQVVNVPGICYFSASCIFSGEVVHQKWVKILMEVSNLIS